jgi:hypothetical protein
LDQVGRDPNAVIPDRRGFASEQPEWLCHV